MSKRPERPHPGPRPLAWLRARDTDLATTRRAVRTAIWMPALLAFGDLVLHNPTTASFAAFGSFAMMLLVEYTGPMVQRLRAHIGLALAWAVLVTLGTLASHIPWLAVTLTVVIGFAVLFSGTVSSVLAGSSTALLLAFILPVTTPVPLSSLPAELAGVGLATAATLVAVSLMWPRKAADPLSAPAALACREAAAELRAGADRLARVRDAPDAVAFQAIGDRAEAAAADLRSGFDAAPYRPAGLSAGSLALVRLVDKLTWLRSIMDEDAARVEQVPSCDRDAPVVRASAAAVLAGAADLLENLRGDREALRTASGELRRDLDAMTEGAAARLPVDRPLGGTDPEIRAFISTLDVSFRAQELGFAVLEIAGDVDRAAEAEQRSLRERLLGLEPGALRRPFAAARDRAASHLRGSSVWLRGSVRGALGLGLAVTIAETTSVQHSFWVSLGVLAVLRSNALNTGQNAVRAVAGTVIGSLIGTGLLLLIGDHGEVLWALLPLAVLAAGLAPSAIGFAAGQAAFTVTLVVMFNVGQDPEWQIVLMRIEDIALGCAVSVLVALFFWPRGAAAAVDRALADAYAHSARYLAGAVQCVLGDRTADRDADAPVALRREAAAASRRLDDAFRGYLVERGAKPVPLADMTALVTGVVGLRLAADAVTALWRGVPREDAGRVGAGVEIMGAAVRVTDWYHRFADGFDRGAPVPEPVERRPRAAARLAASVRGELVDDQGRATPEAVRIIWTGDHVDAARRLQPGLAAAAGARAAGAGHRPSPAR